MVQALAVAPGELAQAAVSDVAWQQADALIQAHDPQPRVGRRRTCQRRILVAIAYRELTGCGWNQLPRELGDDSTVHRTYKRWQRLGILDGLLATLNLDRAGYRAPA